MAGTSRQETALTETIPVIGHVACLKPNTQRRRRRDTTRQLRRVGVVCVYWTLRC